MKIRSIITLTLAIVACGAATAADMAGMKMDKPVAAAMEKPAANRAVGVVKAVNPAAGTITLSHEAVPAIKWPAMTMAFKATKAQVASVKSGDRVNFEFVAKGMDATITTISKAK